MLGGIFHFCHILIELSKRKQWRLCLYTASPESSIIVSQHVRFFMFLFCLVFAMFCVRLFICALWSPAGKGLTSWLSFVVSSVSLSLSHWYPGSGVVLDCIDSWSLHHYLLLYLSQWWATKGSIESTQTRQSLQCSNTQRMGVDKRSGQNQGL